MTEKILSYELIYYTCRSLYRLKSCFVEPTDDVPCPFDALLEPFESSTITSGDTIVCK